MNEKGTGEFEHLQKAISNLTNKIKSMEENDEKRRKEDEEKRKKENEETKQHSEKGK